MGRFGANEADNYGGSGGSSFFQLKNDGDVAKVRFLYNSMEDVLGYAVHEIEVDGKRRYVDCLRSYDEPKSACPLCAANNMQKAKMYIPLYDVDEKEVKIWERGKNFIPKISSLCARYSNADIPLVAQTFEIERHGKPRDTNTTYEIFPVGQPDNKRLEDFPEPPEVLGSIILQKTASEMDEYLNNGSFSSSGSDDRDRTSSEDMPTGRRTPSRRNSDAF